MCEKRKYPSRIFSSLLEVSKLILDLPTTSYVLDHIQINPYLQDIKQKYEFTTFNHENMPGHWTPSLFQDLLTLKLRFGGWFWGEKERQLSDESGLWNSPNKSQAPLWFLPPPPQYCEKKWKKPPAIKWEMPKKCLSPTVQSSLKCEANDSNDIRKIEWEFCTVKVATSMSSIGRLKRPQLCKLFMGAKWPESALMMNKHHSYCYLQSDAGFYHCTDEVVNSKKCKMEIAEKDKDWLTWMQGSYFSHGAIWKSKTST